MQTARSSGSGCEAKPIGGGPWGPLSLPKLAGARTHVGEESGSHCNTSYKRHLAGGGGLRLQKMRCKKMQINANKCKKMPKKKATPQPMHIRSNYTTAFPQQWMLKVLPSHYHTGLNMPSISPLNMSIFVMRRVAFGKPWRYFVSMLPAKLKLHTTPAEVTGT